VTAKAASSGGLSESSSAKGRRGEEAAARFLFDQGWLIVARNFKAGRGEVDIIAEKGDILSFVEVKFWTIFGPEELEWAMGAGKRGRIVETAKIFLARHRQYSNARLRFDLILVREDGSLRRIESAFTGDI